ncbi:unnamed protein product [Didymodactylos carnosus]|uniref:Uncharacterized protein n=1 Tax=Didymodactylos carnosus TaxID=1234261 RepID=A0A8S2QBG4_9BILA|nr:unnamed protein product [Didymodactylos carnosus]CAF4094107.1 unnamed protein product [Didymodactylos carnosus]
MAVQTLEKNFNTLKKSMDENARRLATIEKNNTPCTEKMNVLANMFMLINYNNKKAIKTQVSNGIKKCQFGAENFSTLDEQGRTKNDNDKGFPIMGLIVAGVVLAIAVIRVDVFSFKKKRQQTETYICPINNSNVDLFSCVTNDGFAIQASGKPEP